MKFILISPLHFVTYRTFPVMAGQYKRTTDDALNIVWEIWPQVTSNEWRPYLHLYYVWGQHADEVDYFVDYHVNDFHPYCYPMWFILNALNRSTINYYWNRKYYLINTENRQLNRTNCFVDSATSGHRWTTVCCKEKIIFKLLPWFWTAGNIFTSGGVAGIGGHTLDRFYRYLEISWFPADQPTFKIKRWIDKQCVKKRIWWIYRKNFNCTW